MPIKVGEQSYTTSRDTILWALFDETQDLLEELPCGSWERGIALANLRMIVSMIDRRRMAATVGILR